MASGRDEILGRLRTALERTGDRIQRRGAPPAAALMRVTEARGERRQLAARFGESLVALSGSHEMGVHANEVARRAAQRITTWCAEGGPGEDRGSGRPKAEVLSWGPEELTPPGLAPQLERAGITLVVPEDLRDRAGRYQAAALRVGLTGVDAAIASTGSVVVAAGPKKSRAASLLPTHHLMIVPISRIYPTLEDWFGELRREGRQAEWLRRTTQVVFISGPSKSADIELNLTLGVHGPRVVHAIVYNDVEP